MNFDADKNKSAEEKLELADYGRAEQKRKIVAASRKTVIPAFILAAAVLAVLLSGAPIFIGKEGGSWHFGDWIGGVGDSDYTTSYRTMYNDVFSAIIGGVAILSLVAACIVFTVRYNRSPGVAEVLCIGSAWMSVALCLIGLFVIPSRDFETIGGDDYFVQEGSSLGVSGWFWVLGICLFLFSIYISVLAYNRKHSR